MNPRSIRGTSTEMTDRGVIAGDSVAPQAATESTPTYRVAPARRHWQWISAAIVIIVLASLFVSLWSNPHLDRGVIGHYLFAPQVLRGVRVTIELTIIAMAVGLVIGLLAA